jgi:hypothetical protein
MVYQFFRIKNRSFPIYLSFLALGSCTGNVNEAKITGVYGIDKYVVRDKTLKVKVYPRLTIKNDKTFELSNFNKNDKIKGTWSLISSKNKEEGIVQFKMANREINGLIRGSIFYFRYPNDLYDGKFKSVLYVRQYDNGSK